ncbi:hypothetical protein FGE12_17850 [Aggregicoccus sp. 17bor-14]|uniref:hypothetical protein n=1 Tax=Myxococcaceae TaxID=31 RepID=UPI00129C48AE|nr:MULTISPECIES: hypothetical protein [Myxococcaceae]MBF5044267.1 hypothetical protein [Simulacricoccus sp. 17bor-14]MRI90017.1 hypothetical protein [Aggregicoccus sp. 17bor-14]
MNAKLLTAFLGLAVLAPACVVTPGDCYECDGGYDSSALGGDVNFTWTIAGRFCAQMPDIHGIQVTIPGETLANDGYYACNTAGYDGIELHDFRPGTYSFKLEAVNQLGDVTYAATGNFRVNGDVRVSVDLTPVGGPSSYAYLYWTLPAANGYARPSCYQAGVTDVWVRIDQTWGSFSCADGTGEEGVLTQYLQPGTHEIEIVAGGYDSSGNELALSHYVGTLQTVSGKPVFADYSLWAVGTAALKWQPYTSGGTKLSCDDAGLTKVAINVQDASGKFLYGDAGLEFGCKEAPVTLNYLRPGTYSIYVKASGPGGSYLSSTSNPKRFTVSAYEQVPASAAFEVPLYKAQ